MSHALLVHESSMGSVLKGLRDQRGRQTGSHRDKRWVFQGHSGSCCADGRSRKASQEDTAIFLAGKAGE